MSDSPSDPVPLDELGTSDLVVDSVYAGGTAGTSADDPIGKILPVGNQGGFRYAGSPQKRTVKVAVLYTSGADPDWPDELDVQTGRFTYYGDNKRPGHKLHETSRRGNQLLADVFKAAHGTAQDRADVPPFFLFEKAGERGRSVRFRGLLAPGGEGVAADEDLVAIWRSTRDERFQNYRAVFTVLDTGVISRDWINELLKGQTTRAMAPQVWLDWVAGRSYSALSAPATTVIRTPSDQAPDAAGQAVLKEIHDYFQHRPHDFEACALELWRMQAPATGRIELTPPSRDGGRDAIGEYLLGPKADPVPVEFALEAKCYGPKNSVGTREMARLISRLKHRQFGVFITTSFFNRQAYQEVREDRHPVVLMCGNDIAELLRSRGYSTPAAVRAWLEATFDQASRGRFQSSRSR
ncbi:restriction endonuclease [Streptomyces phaeochromogenes]|uniref:restriction endonuclease n=1 Tax=Streptomyces phaeochromogenes TaxID=1923 RepID=UPI0033DD81A1